MRLSRRPRAIIGTGVVVALAALAGCGGGTGAGTSGSPTPVPGGNITVRLTGDWPDLDPQGITSLNAIGAVTAAYDRLVSIDKDGRVVPYLAKSWKVSPTHLVFTLRNDVTCSDGTHLTPTMVAQSFQRLIDKKLDAPTLWGPGPYKVSADDAADTFTLDLGTPWSDALYSFAVHNASVICPAGLAGDPRVSAVGTGPYTLVSAAHGDSQVLKKRSGWQWGPDGLTSSSPGMPDQITFKVVTNDTTAANLLTTGGLDFGAVNGPDVQRLLQDKSLLHQAGSGSYVFPLVFNESPGLPTADDKVREALMTAIDPKAYIQAAYAGHAHTSPSFLSSTTRCYDASVAKDLPKPSVAQAKKILEGDGYSAGPDGKLQKNGRPLAIRLVSTSANYGRGPEYLAAQWEQAGVSVSFTDVDYATYALNLRAGNFDAGTEAVAAAGPATGSFIGYESGLTPQQGGTNYAHNIDPTMVSMIQAAEGSVGAESCRHWSDVQARMLTQHHMLPLATAETQYFGRGIRVNPVTLVGLNTVSIFLQRVGSAG